MLVYGVDFDPLIKITKFCSELVCRWLFLSLKITDHQIIIAKLTKRLEYNYGYFPELSKSFLVVKQNYKEVARQLQ